MSGQSIGATIRVNRNIRFSGPLVGKIILNSRAAQYLQPAPFLFGTNGITLTGAQLRLARYLPHALELWLVLCSELAVALSRRSA